MGVKPLKRRVMTESTCTKRSKTSSCISSALAAMPPAAPPRPLCADAARAALTAAAPPMPSPVCERTKSATSTSKISRRNLTISTSAMEYGMALSDATTAASSSSRHLSRWCRSTFCVRFVEQSSVRSTNDSSSFETPLRTWRWESFAPPGLRYAGTMGPVSSPESGLYVGTKCSPSLMTTPLSSVSGRKPKANGLVLARSVEQWNIVSSTWQRSRRPASVGIAMRSVSSNLGVLQW